MLICFTRTVAVRSLVACLLLLAVTSIVSGQDRPRYRFYGAPDLLSGYSYPSWILPHLRPRPSFYFYPSRYPDKGLDRTYLKGTPYVGYHPLFPYLRLTAVDEPELTPEQSERLGELRLAQALEAFRNQDYEEATKRAARAALVQMENPAIHELLSLAMLSQQDYLGAAVEARTAIFYRGAVQPDSVRSYRDRADYETAYEKLREKALHFDVQPTASAASFLLAYQYLLQDRKDEARAALKDSLGFSPNDELAKRLLSELGE